MSCQKLSIMQKEKKLHVPILFVCNFLLKIALCSERHCVFYGLESWIGAMGWSTALE